MSFRDGGQLPTARGPGETPIAKTCKGLLVNNLVSNMFVSFVDASAGRCAGPRAAGRIERMA
jgi:hypothetical protein